MKFNCYFQRGKGSLRQRRVHIFFLPLFYSFVLFSLLLVKLSVLYQLHSCIDEPAGLVWHYLVHEGRTSFSVTLSR